MKNQPWNAARAASHRRPHRRSVLKPVGRMSETTTMATRINLACDTPCHGCGHMVCSYPPRQAFTPEVAAAMPRRGIVPVRFTGQQKAGPDGVPVWYRHGGNHPYWTTSPDRGMHPDGAQIPVIMQLGSLWSVSRWRSGRPQANLFESRQRAEAWALE
jgi:hypothetical protein